MSAVTSGAGFFDSGAVAIAEPTLYNSRWMAFTRSRISASWQMERAKPIWEISSSMVP